MSSTMSQVRSPSQATVAAMATTTNATTPARSRPFASLPSPETLSPGSGCLVAVSPIDGFIGTSVHSDEVVFLCCASSARARRAEAGENPCALAIPCSARMRQWQLELPQPRGNEPNAIASAPLADVPTVAGLFGDNVPVPASIEYSVTPPPSV